MDSVLHRISKRFASSLRKLALGFFHPPSIKDSPESYLLPHLNELTLMDTMPIKIIKHFARSPIRTLIFSDGPSCGWHDFRKTILAKEMLPDIEHLDLKHAHFVFLPTKDDWEAFKQEFVQAHKLVNITSPRLQSVRATTFSM